MVASEEMPVEDRLADWEGKATKLPEEKQAEAQQLLGQARSLLTGAEESADFLAKKKEEVKTMEDGGKIQEEQSELETEQKSLTSTLKQLFILFDSLNKAPKIQLELPFIMADESHHLYAEADPANGDIPPLEIEMVSARREKLELAVSQALEEEQKNGKRREVIDYLERVKTGLQELNEYWRAGDYAQTPSGQDGKTYVNQMCVILYSALESLGGEFNIPNLKELGHVSDYVEADELKPEYQNSDTFHRTFYRSSWLPAQQQYRATELARLKAEAKDPQWQDDPNYGHPHAFVCEDHEGSWTPHLAIARPGDRKTYPLDHIYEVAAHWNGENESEGVGNNTTQDARETWYLKVSNLQVVCQHHNSQKGGSKIVWKVGPNFRGPGMEYI